MMQVDSEAGEALLSTKKYYPLFFVRSVGSGLGLCDNDRKKVVGLSRHSLLVYCLACVRSRKGHFLSRFVLFPSFLTF